MRFDFGSGVKGKFYVNGLEFTASDEITSGAIVYTGFLAYTGQWIIMKEDNTDPNNVTWRFACGSTAYSVGLAGRAGLTYYTYDNLVAAF
jgi:hypothetical protein